MLDRFDVRVETSDRSDKGAMPEVDELPRAALVLDVDNGALDPENGAEEETLRRDHAKFSS